MSDLDLDATPFPEPAPDEEAWEAYLVFALEHLGADGSTGLTNKELAVVERALGAQLPFEVGMLLVMGVPDDDGWRDWRDDPAEQLHEWATHVRDGVVFDVRENDFWSPSFGPRPAELDKRCEVAGDAVDQLPPLFPLYRHRAVPTVAPDGFESSSGNPVLSVVGTDVIQYAPDLAAWLHRDFRVPLPTWEQVGDRRFSFWSELTHR